jgi:SAM-dependent methyltransferase
MAPDADCKFLWSSEDYWQARFHLGDTPWELGAPSVVLFEALGCVPPISDDLKGLTVLSPGCGTGSDAVELAIRGAYVIAVDWSNAAAAGLKSRLDSLGRPDIASRVQFMSGDFFEVNPVSVDLVCEHTFFCAIDPAMRVRYAEKIASWIKPGGYLVANFFVASEEEIKQLANKSLTKDRIGPPFATTESELREIFGKNFRFLELRPATVGESTRRPGLEWVGVLERGELG